MSQANRSPDEELRAYFEDLGRPLAEARCNELLDHLLAAPSAVFAVAENADNASPASVHRTLDAAKREAERLAEQLPSRNAPWSWRQIDPTSWELVNANDYPIYLIDQIQVLD